MRTVDGDAVLGFIGSIDDAIDEAGRGKHKAFDLIAALRRRGLKIVAAEMPEEPKAARTSDFLVP